MKVSASLPFIKIAILHREEWWVILFGLRFHMVAFWWLFLWNFSGFVRERLASLSSI